MPEDNPNIEVEPTQEEWHNFNRACYMNALVEDSHGAALNAGWYTDIETGLPKVRNNGEQLLLIVSEIVEGFEGIRKNLKDDKLPQYEMIDVELIDAAIRIFDFLGKRGVNAGEIYVAKRRFNDSRADHKIENRAKTGGKAF